MKLLTDTNELTNVFTELLARYNHFYCCTAWAGNPDEFKVGMILKRHVNKIKKAVVGLHFYQTHPNFIKTFMDIKGMRFHMRSNGVFHDKIYFFSNSPKDWSAIIGSSNFTNGGFVSNSECNVLISKEDDKDGIVYQGLKNKIKSIWKESDVFSKKKLEEYRECYSRQIGKLDSLTSIVKTKKREFDASPLSLIRNLDEPTRLNIAGFVPSSCKFAHFGTTKRNHRFGQQIKLNDRYLSKALDEIPLTGQVTFEDYQKYIRFFTNNWTDPIATATRLLAMKRPDLFLCVNTANKCQLAKYLSIPPSRLSLENYWDEVIVPIRQSQWFNVPKRNDIGKEYWKYRVALLDLLIYEP